MLLNLSRGSVVDFEVLERGLEDNFIGTAHIGGYSHQATYKMSYFVAQK